MSEEEKVRWEVIETDKAFYVVPIDDIGVHESGFECKCSPKIVKHKEHDKPTIVHNSYDGRELSELDQLNLN